MPPLALNPADDLGLFDFQAEDLSRIACRDAAILSWEQGLGKTFGGLIYATLKGGHRNLIIAPQSLYSQWEADAAKLGIRLHRIQNMEDALHVGRTQPEGWYFIHYELLKGNGRPNRRVKGGPEGMTGLPPKLNDGEVWRQGPMWEELGGGATKKSAAYAYAHYGPTCPACGARWRGAGELPPAQCRCGHVNAYADLRTDEDEEQSFITWCVNCGEVVDWNGVSCASCGHHRYRARPRSIYQLLKHYADTIVVDEGVKLKNIESLQAQSVHALHADHKLILSGSPIKNTLADIFWLLHWAFGEGSAIFPYRYHGGQAKFMEDFCVYYQEGTDYERGNTSGKRFQPEITNVSMLWRLLGPAICRRRKRDVEGLEMVDRTTHFVALPPAKEQQQAYTWWMQNFAEWFRSVHGGDERMIELRQKLLGQLNKLKLVTTIPSSQKLETELDEDGLTKAGYKLGDGLTPKSVWVLESCLQWTHEGHQTVLFTTLQDNANFLWAELNRLGLRATIANGNVPPKQRQNVIDDFKKGDYDILIAGTEAVNLGHNLENASRVIMTDFPWEHSTLRQAIERVHRLTSQYDVHIYMLYHEDMIDAYHLEMIRRKADSSDIALEGEVNDQQEQRVDLFKMAQQMMSDWTGFMENGVPHQKDLRGQVAKLEPYDVTSLREPSQDSPTHTGATDLQVQETVSEENELVELSLF